jgi:GcrA cell cycle regulator
LSWTDERIDQLKRMWEGGMTASQIAEELGGVSRNAVIGKAHRLGLQSRPSPVKGGEAADTEKKAEKPVVPSPQAEAVSPAPPPPPPSAPVPMSAPTITAPAPAEAPQPLVRSIGPGGFQRAMPGDQTPSTPAPPRRLVPAKPSAEMAGKTTLLDLNDKICKWPLGHPGEPDFHFCGQPINPGFPYCLDHCSVAYQAQLPRRDRRPPPPLPFGGPRVR